MDPATHEMGGITEGIDELLRLLSGPHANATLRALVERVAISPGKMTVHLKPDILAERLAIDTARLRHLGRQLQTITGTGNRLSGGTEHRERLAVVEQAARVAATPKRHTRRRP